MRALKYQLIESPDKLAGVIGVLESQDAVAVDLEADSMFHYKEKVCLIQIATKNHSFVIDPLKIPDLSLLKPLFRNSKIQKIFHGGDYDVRSLYRDFNIVIQNMFDTQLASRFLGDRSTGLEAVVHKRFNVKLNKKYQKKDWSERPLPEKMVEYAVRDTFYLLPLSEIMHKELLEKGRLQWVKEECEILSRVRAMQNNGEPLFLKFKGAGRLSHRRLAVLEAILQFRKKVAEEKDRPLFKVFSNTSAMKLAVSKPKTLQELKKSNTLSAKQAKMYGPELVAFIREALSIPIEQLPSYPRKKAPQLDPNVPKRVNALRNWRDSYAKKLNIDSSIITPKSIMTALAIKKPQKIDDLDSIDELKNWQKKEFGNHILDILNQCS
ncbi:MAG: HRDC domain-containing protein [Desulfobacterales bacterium]